MVTYNTHIIDQTTKDKFHPFIAKAVEPMVPIHYEKIQLKKEYIVVDMVAQEYSMSGWNNVSKRMLIVGKLVNGQIKVVEVKQINNMNYKAPIPCSDSNTNCHTYQNCHWYPKKQMPMNLSKMVVPKEQGQKIKDIKYEQRDFDELRHWDP